MQNHDVMVPPNYPITSVDHALRIIQMLRDSGEVRISGVAAELDVSVSTAHRLLAMLVYRGFAVQDEARVYFPGPALRTAATNTNVVRTIRAVALPHLEVLAGYLNETVNLVVRTGSWVRFLATVEGQHVLRVGDRAGTVLDARRASGGKVLLAELDRTTLDRMYRGESAKLYGQLMSDSAYRGLIRELGRVRRQGFAFNRGETESGVVALGVPLRDRSRLAVASVSVSVPHSRASLLERDTVRELTLLNCKEIESELVDELP